MRRSLLILALFAAALVPAGAGPAIAGAPSIGRLHLPAPTGPDAVGTRSLLLTRK